jgi:cadmium resistance protein CadD (predicted permease)
MNIEELSVAVSAFAATDIDDFVLLAALFGGGKLKSRSIVIGQLVGIGALVLVSSVAAMAALSIPPGWTNLLGVVPLALGIRGAMSWFRRDEADQTFDDWKPFNAFGRSETFAVAGLTVINGGDNLAVYIPLFSSSAAAIPQYAAVFAVMTLLWCWIGRALVTHPSVRLVIERFGHVLVPMVLFGLGLHILSGAFVLLH